MALLAIHLRRWEIASPTEISALGQWHSIRVHGSVFRALPVTFMAVKWAVIFGGSIVIVIGLAHPVDVSLDGLDG